MRPRRTLTLTRMLALAATLLLAGCGFRLQGSSVLPEGLDQVYVTTRDELSAFSVELFRGLERAGARRAASTGEADAVLRITVDRTGRRVLSVSARNTPQEFEIFYQVEYSIERAGAEVVPRQRLELTRNISFDESQLLAKDREEEILRDAMARDLAGLVLRRLESLPPVQSDPSR
jgi:LPS-assembly lipoprotein